MHVQAELRKNVFQVIDEQDDENVVPPPLNPKMRQLLSLQGERQNTVALGGAQVCARTGRAQLELVKDFLEYHELDFTLSVLQSETKLVWGKWECLPFH